MTLTGTGFTDAIGVQIGGISADFTVLSDNTILTMAPPQTGTVNITVTSYSGTSQSLPANSFTYSAAAAPTVSSLSPNTGDTTGDTVVDINGSGLSGATNVTFDGVATDFTIVNDSLILATAPPTSVATGGTPIAVQVTTAAGTSSTGSSSNFSYTAPENSTPAVTQVTPNTGSTAGGDVITIVGSNFVGVTEVDFGSVATDAFTVNSATSITVTAPPNNDTSGYVNVVVKTTSGQSSTGSAATSHTVPRPAPAP